MKLVKRLFFRFVVVAVSAGLIISSSYSSATPITTWVVDPSGSGAVVYSGLTTDSPVLGDGITDKNANSGIIDGKFSTLSLLDGQTIILSGSMTITGAKVTGEDIGLQFGLMYEPGPVDDDKAWSGYFANNSNAGQSVGSLRARNPSLNASTIWISGANTTLLTSVPATGNGTFSSGTYSLNMQVERTGADVIVSASILGTGATVFTNVFTPTLVTTAALKTFDFNRVGIWSVSPLDAEQVSFTSIDVSVIPEPSMYLFAGLGLVGSVFFFFRKKS